MERYTHRDGMIFGLSRNGAGTDFDALLVLLKGDASLFCTMLNLAHCEGEQKGMEQARKIVFDKPESEAALEGAISNMLDSGDLELDDEDRANEQAAQVDRTLQATIRRMKQ